MKSEIFRVRRSSIKVNIATSFHLFTEALTRVAMACKPLITSTPLKGIKRPKLDMDSSSSSLALGNLSEQSESDFEVIMSPIKDDCHTSEFSSNIIDDCDGDTDSCFAVFPSFDADDQQIDRHAREERDNGTSYQNSVSESEAEAFFPSLDQSAQSEQSSLEQKSNISMTIAEAITTAREKDLSIIGPTLIKPCCSQQCLQNLTANEVLKLYTQFKVFNAVQQRQWLVDKLNENTCCNTSSQKDETTYIVTGKAVCMQNSMVSSFTNFTKASLLSYESCQRRSNKLTRTW